MTEFKLRERGMKLPRLAYELLPTLYIVAGYLTVASLEHTAAFFSGAIFNMAGVLVFYFRLQYRGDLSEVQKRNRR